MLIKENMNNNKKFIFKTAFPVRGFLSTNQGVIPKVNTSIFKKNTH